MHRAILYIDTVCIDQNVTLPPSQYYICFISFYAHNMIISESLLLFLYTAPVESHTTTATLSYLKLKKSSDFDCAHNIK